MKKKYGIIITVFLMIIGFAAVSTTLFINGQVNVAANTKDFDIYFSEAVVDGEDVSNEVIDSTKKEITYETKTLSLKDETSILDFEVTNNSTQYDAKVTINCTIDQNSTYKNLVIVKTDQSNYIVPAQTRKNGKVTIILKDTYVEATPTKIAFTCELVSEANSLDNLVEEVIEDAPTYQITGTLKDSNGNILANQKAVVYSETPHYIETDDYGFFYVGGLEKGRHQIYIVNTDMNGRTKEEVKENSVDTATVTTSSKSIKFKNIILDSFIVEPDKTGNITLTLDANGGIIDSKKLETPIYSKINNLPLPTKDKYEFNGWLVDGKEITNKTIIKENEILTASWTKVVYDVILNKDNGIKNVTGANSYKVGETVTISATMNAEYLFDGWSGTYSSQNNDYTFVMPNSDVILTAKSSKCSHSFTSTIIKAATCTASGTTKHTCSVCGYSYEETVNQLGHSSVSSNNAKAATCLAAGKYSDTKCSRCGVTLTTGSSIPALGHSWNSGVVTKAATCTATGVKTYTCSRCKTTRTETIPKLTSGCTATRSASGNASDGNKGTWTATYTCSNGVGTMTSCSYTNSGYGYSNFACNGGAYGGALFMCTCDIVHEEYLNLRCHTSMVASWNDTKSYLVECANLPKTISC